MKLCRGSAEYVEVVPFPKDQYVVFDENQQDMFTRVGYELDFAYI